jgi:hypothetical protein
MGNMGWKRAFNRVIASSALFSNKFVNAFFELVFFVDL